MNKNKLLILSIFTILSLAACGNGETPTTGVTTSNDPTTTVTTTQNVTTPAVTTPEITTPTPTTLTPSTPTPTTPEVIETYTVVWKNDDGTVLETDNNVLKGTIPTYDGETPTKEGNEDITYVFNGWTPAINEVTTNAIYTATYKEVNTGDIDINTNPILLNDKKTVQYGLYPQTVVNDKTLITTLNSLEVLSNGWVLCDGTYYTKVTASTFTNEDYKFDNGALINNGEEYWFECKPITWNVLDNNNGTYTLLSSMLLDVQKYYKDYTNRIIDGHTVYANNYEHSDIRKWLNNDFYNKAFALNNVYIQSTSINNGVSSTDSNSNEYVCNNTLDKVYLLSYEEYLKADYGFSTINGLSTSRECKTTDYTRAIGAWCNEETSLSNNGTYWTRSPSSEYYYTAYNVNSGGYLSNYAVDGNSHCVRPCITITISE